LHSFEPIDLGTYRGDDYFLTGFVDPEPADGGHYDPATDADEYGVSLARSTVVGANIEVVRMDTAHGQDPHMDRVYLPPDTDEERKVELGEGYTYKRMKQYLLTHWKDYVDRYIYYDE